MAENRVQQLCENARKLGEEVNANVFLYSGFIDNYGYGQMVSEIARSQKCHSKESAVLFLITRGGSANSAFQIARLFQRAFDKFIIFPTSLCKSAGTLITLGSNELWMDDHSELGSVDVQLLIRDEIGSRKSGLLTRSAFEALGQECRRLYENVMLDIKSGSEDLVSFNTASEIAAKIVIGVMAPIYQQIDPEAYGGDYRSLRVAEEYGKRLAKKGGNCKLKTIQRLVSEYPSHDFIIDIDEAKLLFDVVQTPPEIAYNVITSFTDLFYTLPHKPYALWLEESTQENEGVNYDDEKNGKESNPQENRNNKSTE